MLSSGVKFLKDSDCQKYLNRFDGVIQNKTRLTSSETRCIHIK